MSARVQQASKRAHRVGVRPLPALVALGLAACGARGDLLYGEAELGGAGVPSFTGGAGGRGSSGSSSSGSSSSGTSAGGASAGAAGSSGVAGAGNVEPPVDPQAIGCARTGVFTGEVEATRTEDLRVLEGCTHIRGNLLLAGERIDYQPIRSLREISGTLRIVGFSRSLGGLEQLTRVGELILDTVNAPTLAPLAGLQEVGTLTIAGSHLPDLAGLGGLRKLRALNISSSTLDSLQGLAASERFSQVTLGSSSIGSIAALAGVEGIDALSIVKVAGLKTLSGLELLQDARSIFVSENIELENVDALGGLRTLNELVVKENASLDHLPDFPALVELTSFEFQKNALVRATPLFGGLKRIGRISILQNQALSTVEFPFLEEVGPVGASATFGPLGVFEVSENGNLGEVSAPRLARTGTLFIGKNPLLQRVALTGLVSSRDELMVVLNRQLPPGSLFDLFDVETSHLKLAGNQGEPEVLAPCPWPQDGVCDETRAICPSGTDMQDCILF